MCILMVSYHFESHGSCFEQCGSEGLRKALEGAFLWFLITLTL